MSLRKVTLLFSTVVILASAGCATPSSPDKDTSAATNNNDMPFPKLENGMAADVVREKLGTPAEIQPMASPTGKAEVWVYKFEKIAGLKQVASGTRDLQVASMSGGGSGVVTIQEPVYTLAEKRSAITLSLLMFDDRLQSQKAKVEDVVEHR